MSDIEDKLVFALLPLKDDPIPGLLLGIPRGAWEYMRDGKTHTLDLRPLGVDLKLLMYGAENHTAALKVIEDAARENGIALLDERRADFTWNPDRKR